MSSLKHHLSLIIPLIALLFSLESIVLIQRAVAGYEANLGKSYSIVIATRKEVSLEEIKRVVKEAEGLKAIAPDAVLEKLQKDISSANLALLKDSLPQFYSLSLDSFPDKSRLGAIDAALKKMNGVERVESFAKSHDQIYRLLLLLKSSVMVFAGLISIISLLLMVKQIEIWRFEHSERMEIMGYFGAPSWMRNGLLFRLALVDSLIAAGIIGAGMIYLSQDPTTLTLIGDVGLDGSIFAPEHDSLLLLLGGVGVSILSVWMVILRPRG
ncbi:FtsX-like permease family protein [Wolinella succinogenes]|uniref:FtsX-like permease family protein n=1 Tax=Wolinella succinogenes TaxID=844 RepID=UPI0016981888|nr:FtsX-like permease family protein [Wolinella succinogenes]NLU35260.1 cell division protein FtsX [Wolinella succinogenes]